MLTVTRPVERSPPIYFLNATGLRWVTLLCAVGPSLDRPHSFCTNEKGWDPKRPFHGSCPCSNKHRPGPGSAGAVCNLDSLPANLVPDPEPTRPARGFVRTRIRRQAGSRKKVRRGKITESGELKCYSLVTRTQNRPHHRTCPCSALR